MTLAAFWHPRGAAAAGMQIGEAVPGSPGPDLDVAIVAPPARAGRRHLRRAVAAAAARLAPDGVAWIVVGRPRRGSAERAARQAGLVVADRVLVVGPWPASTHLVALLPAALRDAAVRHLGLAPRQARLLAAVCDAPGGRMLLSRAAPRCAIVARKPHARACLAWLGEIDGAAVDGATVSAGPRSDARVAVALRFRDGSQAPDLAVKVALDAAGTARLQGERAALEHLGAVAGRAGAALPALRPRRSPTVLTTEVLPGRPASALLARDPAHLDGILERVGDWLLAWNLATAGFAPAPAQLLERRLLGPATRVAAALPATSSHAEAMYSLASRLEDAPLVTVAAHEDLTMSNVLLSAGGIGVVDWEAASADALALLDLWYALADAVARARRVRHADAVEALAGGRSQLPQAVAALPARHAAALGLSPDQALLGFHACWLGHADDELSRGVRGPFLDVVAALAATGRPR